jgi:hypothetical protein
VGCGFVAAEAIGPEAEAMLKRVIKLRKRKPAGIQKQPAPAGGGAAAAAGPEASGGGAQ